MGFLDKATEKLSKVTEQAKDKIDDVKDKRKSGSLLEDLGRIVFRQNSGRAKDDDAAEIARIVAELRALEATGVEVIPSDQPPPPETPPTPPASPNPPSSPSGGFPSPS